MRTASGTLVVIAALCAMTVTGCQKQLQLTFVNHTNSVLQVKVTTPETGTMQAGSVGPSGTSLRFTIRIKAEELPTTCTCTVGLASKTFNVTEDTKGELWFHYTEKGLAGPTDKAGTLLDVRKEEESR